MFIDITSKKEKLAMKAHAQVVKAVELLVLASKKGNRNVQMPGDGRYQPEELRPYLGYDMWACWLVLVEWFWMKTLAKMGVMPEEDAKLLSMRLLIRLLNNITTTAQDIMEKHGQHDILALVAIMKQILPARLHRWLHLCPTSYDIICTAYALQLWFMFQDVFVPKMRELDSLWRELIKQNVNVIEAGRTHLQTALPITVGFWLANLHNRYVKSARIANKLSCEVPGKFSGAVGTSASQYPVLGSLRGEEYLLEMLGLPAAMVTTQITPPEATARFYHELVLLSGALANLGEDARILQSSQFGEIMSASSTSSTMSHKTANPIAAENLCGMHATVIAEYMKVLMTLVSDLQRDLRASNVMRSYSAVSVYTYQQILTAIRLLKSFRINQEKCLENFNRDGKLVVAEVLHLILQKEGFPGAHEFVNKTVVPAARESGKDLWNVMNDLATSDSYRDRKEGIIWKAIMSKYDPFHRTTSRETLEYLLQRPSEYIGKASVIALVEADNKL